MCIIPMVSFLYHLCVWFYFCIIALSVDLRHHFIREVVEEEKIKVTYIPTDENATDIFTKALARPKYVVFVKRLGLREGKQGVKKGVKG